MLKVELLLQPRLFRTAVGAAQPSSLLLKLTFRWDRNIDPPHSAHLAIPGEQV